MSEKRVIINNIKDYMGTGAGSDDPLGMIVTRKNTPERNLLAAVMLRAIEDLNLKAEKYCKDKDSAIAWILNEDDDELSFNWVAHCLDLKPDLIRCALRKVNLL